MERKAGQIDPRERELARHIGNVEGAKKLSEQLDKPSQPIITADHSASMEGLVTFLAKNEGMVDVFIGNKKS